jgi:hypothetical protein
MKKLYTMFLLGAITALGADHGQVVKDVLQSSYVAHVDVGKNGADIDINRVEMALQAKLKAAREESTAYHASKDWKPTPGSDELDNLRITFGELADIPEDAAVRINGWTIINAPEESLLGTRVCNKEGKYINHLTIYRISMVPIEYRGETMLRPVLYASGHIQDNGVLVRWGDIKDKVAIENTPQRRQELEAMKQKGYAMERGAF